jgi:hypothetical protein
LTEEYSASSISPNGANYARCADANGHLVIAGDLFIFRKAFGAHTSRLCGRQSEVTLVFWHAGGLNGHFVKLCEFLGFQGSGCLPVRSNSQPARILQLAAT